MNVVYSNSDGDIVTVAGANIVHRDFKEALKNLVPHLAILTEQREAYNRTLEELEGQRGWEEKSVFTRISVSSVTFNAGGVVVSGARVLDRGDIINLDAPKVSTADDENYDYLPELSLAVDNLKYEAEQYVAERKWGLKQGELDFEEADDPFAGIEAGDPFAGIKAGAVPSVSVEMETKAVSGGRKKKGCKKKTEAA